MSAAGTMQNGHTPLWAITDGKREALPLRLETGGAAGLVSGVAQVGGAFHPVRGIAGGMMSGIWHFEIVAGSSVPPGITAKARVDPNFVNKNSPAIERPITLYVRRAASGNKATAFCQVAKSGVDVFYWIDGDFGYAPSGRIGRQAIQQLADAAYRQLVTAPGKQSPASAITSNLHIALELDHRLIRPRV
jgi:hypothetical protein